MIWRPADCLHLGHVPGMTRIWIIPLNLKRQVKTAVPVNSFLRLHVLVNTSKMIANYLTWRYDHDGKAPWKCLLSETLSREYWVVRNQYSCFFFTSEDRICANLRVHEQSTNMTS